MEIDGRQYSLEILDTAGTVRRTVALMSCGDDVRILGGVLSDARFVRQERAGFHSRVFDRLASNVQRSG